MIPKYLYIASFPTGSNYICNPPVTDTDIDEMFLVRSIDHAMDVLESNGWKLCGNEEGYGDTQWLAFRKGKYNALITSSTTYFNNFLKATEEAKKRNLLDKKDRIALFNEMCNKGYVNVTYGHYLDIDFDINWDRAVDPLPVQAL